MASFCFGVNPPRAILDWTLYYHIHRVANSWTSSKLDPLMDYVQ